MSYKRTFKFSIPSYKVMSSPWAVISKSYSMTIACNDQRIDEFEMILANIYWMLIFHVTQ